MEDLDPVGMWPKDVWDRKRQELKSIFGDADVILSNNLQYMGISVSSNSNMINLPILLKICEILECSPENLYWNADFEPGYYPGDDEHSLKFEVKRYEVK